MKLVSILRQRKKQRPNLPHSLEEVDIQSYGDLTKTERGRDFYRGKTKTTCGELFMSDVQAQIAVEADTLFLDGTFAITPEPFFQVFILRAKVGDNRYTIAYALLPNKREITYTELFQLLVDVCQAATDKTINPVSIHIDCELAIINSVIKVFKNVQIRLCRFHIVDAIRVNGDKVGLRRLIKDHNDLKRFYNKVRQIFFFPPPLWPRTWKLMVDLLSREVRDHPTVAKFLEYLVSASWIEYPLLQPVTAKVIIESRHV